MLEREDNSEQDFFGSERAANFLDII